MIRDYAPIRELPNAAIQPDPNLDYKIVYSIEKPADEPGDLNSGLLHIARTINLYEWAGIPHSHMHLVGIVHGPATPIVLSNEAYYQAFSRDNPDQELIEEIVDAGVNLFVCGQSLIGQGYDREEISPNVQLALSALTVLPTYQLRGYALLMY